MTTNCILSRKLITGVSGILSTYASSNYKKIHGKTYLVKGKTRYWMKKGWKIIKEIRIWLWTKTGLKSSSLEWTLTVLNSKYSKNRPLIQATNSSTKRVKFTLCSKILSLTIWALQWYNLNQIVQTLHTNLKILTN